MDLNRKDLDAAVAQGVLEAEQAQRLWLFMTDRHKDTPSFRFTHILYYLGGLIAIGAMTLFMNLGWERFGGWGLLLIALAYAGAGLALTEYFLRRGLSIPAGICGAFVVALTPLAIYGLQAGLGYWNDDKPYRDYHRYIDWRWLLMELGTLASGAVMLWRYRLPFMVMPVAVTLWYLSMDLTPFLFGEKDYGWGYRKLVSLWFGLLMSLLAFWVDIRNRTDRDYAFWLYLFGALTVWCGLSMMESNSELNQFLYFCINVLMIGIGAVLSRRVFVVFGGLGCAGYLAHLADSVFKDSMLFPFALTLIGLGIVYLGIVWQRNEEALGERLRSLLPAALSALIVKRQ